MKTPIIILATLLCASACATAQQNANWIQMASPAKTASDIFTPCGIPTIILNGQMWQSLDTGMTWQVVDNVPISNEHFWTTSEVIFNNVTPFCQSSQTLVKYYDCQSPDTSYFQYVATNESCWHSGGHSYGISGLYNKILVMGSSSWQYMGQSTSCDHQASLDWGHTWFNVACDFSQKYYPDTMVTAVGNELTLHLPGYDQPSYSLGTQPNPSGSIASILYSGGMIFMLTYEATAGLQLFTSSDLGQQWSIDPLPLQGFYQNLYFNGGILFLKTTSGIYYKTASMPSLQPIYENGTSTKKHIANYLANSLLVIVATKDGEIMVTHDFGQSWATADLPIVPIGLQQLTHNGESLLCYTTEPYGTNMVVSDSDTSYHYIMDVGQTLEYPSAVVEVGSAIYKVLTNCSVYRSYDQGQQWELLDFPDSLGNCIGNIIRSDGDTLFISSGPGVVYFTKDGAQTWESIPVPTTDYFADFQASGNDWLLLSPDNYSYKVLHAEASNGNWTDVTPSDFRPQRLCKSGNRIYALGVTNADEWNVRLWDAAENSWGIVGDVLKTPSTSQYVASDFFLVQTLDTVFVRHANDLWKPLPQPFSDPRGWAKHDTTLFAASHHEGLWRTSMLPGACHRFSNTSAHLCQGDSIFFNGQHLYDAGIYTANFPAQDGASCDSTSVLHLIISDSLFVMEAAFCQGDSIKFGNTWLESSGSYVAHYPTALGCDSIAQLNLTVFPLTPDYFESVALCHGANYYSPFGQAYWQTGQYEEHLLDSNGCPFTYHLDLLQYPFTELLIHTFVVFPFTIEDSTYLEEALHYQYYLDTNGCAGLKIYLIHEATVDNQTTLEVAGEWATLSPNPASGSVRISVGTTGPSSYRVTFINQWGQILLARQFDERSEEVDLGKLPSGLYMVRIEGSQDQVMTKKLLVMRIRG